jgi:hypothetical protein
MTEVCAEGVAGRASVRVLRTPEPEAEAATLVDGHGADLATDLTTAEALVRHRVEAGRRALRPEGTADELGLLERADAIRTEAGEQPPISDDDVAELERLAADLARAARIRERTEARFTETLQAKLAASAGVALHPAAIKEAGEAVVAAETALAEADQALVDHGPAPSPPPAEPVEPDWRLGGGERHDDDPVLARPLDDFDEVSLERQRALTRGVAVFLVLVGFGVIALGLDLSPLIAVALVAIGLVLGVATVVGGRRAASHLAQDKVHNAARLAELGDPEPPPAPPPDEPVGTTPTGDADRWLEEQAELDAACEEAEELVRTARRRWRQLAGLDADPYEPEGVIRAHDPQLAFDDRVALASPTVRTVAAFHRKAQARWRVLWAHLGHDEPPEAEDLESTLDGLLGDHRHRQGELRRLEAAEERARAEADARRPLVLVEPRAWVSPTRLAQLLSSIPPQGEVYIVERGRADGEDQPVS